MASTAFLVSVIQKWLFTAAVEFTARGSHVDLQ
jgi:hypothetical protein